MEDLKNSSADKRIRALAIARSVERNVKPIQSQFAVPGSQADDFNQALKLLEEIGEDVDVFRLPKDTITTNNRRERFAERDTLYGKVSALIDYFAIRQAVLDLAEEMKQEPARMIGYETPHNRN